MKKLRTILAAITLMTVVVAQTASAGNSWSFVMLGDTRDADDTSTGINSNLNAMAQKIALMNPEFVIMAGDLCNGDCINTNSPLYPSGGIFTNAAAKTIYMGFFANWKEAMKPVFDYDMHTGIPIYTVRGNHENEDAENAPIEVLKQAYKEAFSEYVPTNGPNNGPNDDQRGFSWAFTHNNVTFVAADQYFNFDTNYVATTPWSGYHSLDRHWVTQQLWQSTSPYKIFIAHEPIFQTQGNGKGQEDNVVAQHFFGTNTAAIQIRSNFWNDIGDAGTQMYLAGHLHLETVALTTNGHGRTLVQLTAGNGGAPPQNFIDDPEPGVTTLYNNGNILVTNYQTMTVSVQGSCGFSHAIVDDEKMTIYYYSMNPTNGVWSKADYITVIPSARTRSVISAPIDPNTGTFTYTRSDPAGTGLNYGVDTSSDLITWTTNAAAVQTVTATATNNIQTVRVTLGGAKPLTSPKFVRIEAQ